MVHVTGSSSKTSASEAAKTPGSDRRPWSPPALELLPKLSDLTLQSPGGIPGGGGTGGGGSTVIP